MNPQTSSVGRNFSEATLRVRVHLNLAKPERAENAVRVLAPSGAWVTVAYATELLLENVIPVVHLDSQEKIRDGDSRKVPHAFMEGDLIHFKGRRRDKAPVHLTQLAAPFLIHNAGFQDTLTQAQQISHPINYNPRFASCFYRDQDNKAAIADRFVQSQQIIVIGWDFLAIAPDFTPLLAHDRCAHEALTKASPSEHHALNQGRDTTHKLWESADIPARAGKNQNKDTQPRKRRLWR